MAGILLGFGCLLVMELKKASLGLRMVLRANHLIEFAGPNLNKVRSLRLHNCRLRYPFMCLLRQHAMHVRVASGPWDLPTHRNPTS